MAKNLFHTWRIVEANENPPYDPLRIECPQCGKRAGQPCLKAADEKNLARSDEPTPKPPS